MIYRDNDVLRTTRSFTATGLSDDETYTFPAGTLCTVVTSGEGRCEVEFIIDFPDGIECALASVEDGDAEVVPRSEWPAIRAAEAREAPAVGTPVGRGRRA